MTTPGRPRITWHGHACIEIVTNEGRRVLVDPWLSNPTSRTTPDEIERCDLLLVTHGHADHVGDALAIARRLHPVWPCIHELSLWVGRHVPEVAPDLVGMNKGGTVSAAGLRVTMVPADHSGGAWAPIGEELVYFGDPAGFVIELENGFRIYHAGDTNVFGDMRLIRELHRPDLAILPIGGHYTMDPRAAALAVELLGVGEVLPMHWGTFPILAGTPAALRASLAERGLGAVVVHELAPGDSIG